MDQVIDFFKDLFTTELWPARWNCGYWSDFHGWLYIVSDLAIWFAYFAIPVIILGYIARKKYELKFTTTYILFASFILLCGSTHLLDAAMFWSPMYRLSAIVRFLTGVVSLFTVYHLIQILPDAFRQKTSLVLEREIARRTIAEKKLADANKDLQSFAYMASHDLQEPLRKITLFTESLRETNHQQLDDKSREWVDKTIHAAQRMQKMVRDLLKLSSFSEDIRMEPTDLNSVLQQSLADLDIKIRDTNTTINASTLPFAMANHAYLVQLFNNLLSNAIKFADATPRITVTGARNGSTVQVSITDNGVGMDPEETGRIFLPFQRLHPKSAFEGSGIGLAICRKIIEIHKGSIDVHSAPGQGSTFTISLPAA